MAVDFKHPLYSEYLPKWTRIEDITTMQNLTDYLLTLNPKDTSQENQTRNAQYRARAVFYDIAGRTASSLVGSIFRKWPTLVVPPEMEYLKESADGAGVSIYQSSQATASDVLRKGRAGLYVAFPRTEGEVKRQDILDGRYVASIVRYAPEQIINWRTEPDGARIVLQMIALMQTEEVVTDDGFGVTEQPMIRVLRLDPDGMVEEIYRKDRDTGAYMLSEAHAPTDSTGARWQEIPFTFVGSQNNDTTPDDPPMLGIVDVNIGHYRNSADYEDSVWFAGQAQPYMTGLDQAYVDFMRDNQMYVGSRNLIGVPSGETFGFAQVEPNTMVKEAMDAKVVMMEKMGARLVQAGSATKTATQAGSDQEMQTSVLALVASNVSEAYTKALKWVCRYLGAPDADVAYTLNQEFVDVVAEPQMLQQMSAGFLQGTVTPAAMLSWLKAAGLEDNEKTLESWLAELQGESNLELSDE